MKVIDAGKLYWILDDLAKNVKANFQYDMLVGEAESKIKSLLESCVPEKKDVGGNALLGHMTALRYEGMNAAREVMLKKIREL